VHFAQTVLAVAQQMVANWMMFWPQDEHQAMYAIRLHKRVVMLSKSEGPQKWLAPYGTDVQRVACTIDVCVLERKSHRQTKMIM
jgi:hypothetical protein